MRPVIFPLVALLSGTVLGFPAVAQRHGDAAAPIAAVSTLDLTRYAGLWYEIARFPNRFERDCAAVTAEYTLNDDATVEVRNSCRKGGIDGPLEVAEGSARVEGPGRLSVNFVWFLPFLRGDYWVLAVDPEYSLAVVGEPGRNLGWILARTPRISDADYTGALEVLVRNGYDPAGLERVAQP